MIGIFYSLIKKDIKSLFLFESNSFKIYSGNLGTLPKDVGICFNLKMIQIDSIRVQVPNICSITVKENAFTYMENTIDIVLVITPISLLSLDSTKVIVFRSLLSVSQQQDQNRFRFLLLPSSIKPLSRSLELFLFSASVALATHSFLVTWYQQFSSAQLIPTIITLLLLLLW